MGRNFTSKDYYDFLLYVAVDAALEAGEEIIRVRKSANIGTRKKLDKSFVTDADINANNIITEKLRSTNIIVVSEEVIDTGDRFNVESFWLLDPLDGTSEFVDGGDEYTVNIALIENEKVVLGVVYVPETKELYFAHKELGSYKYVGDVLKDAEKDPHNDIVRISTKLPYIETEKYTIVASKKNLDEETSFFIELISDGRDVEYKNRSSSLKFCMIAEGTADLYPRFYSLAEWDIAAAHAIVKFAGKNVYEFDGTEVDYNTKYLVAPQFIAK